MTPKFLHEWAKVPHPRRKGELTNVCKVCGVGKPVVDNERYQVVLTGECPVKLRRALDAMMGSARGVVVVTIEGTVELKVKAIKAFRTAVPPEFDGSLKANQARVETLMVESRVTCVVRASALDQFRADLAECGNIIVVAPEAIPIEEPSPQARRVLDALRRKPDLLDELRVLLAHGEDP